MSIQYLESESEDGPGGYSCPNCFATFPPESINQKEEAALCAECGQLNRLWNLSPFEQPAIDTLERNVPSCSIWVSHEQVVIQASLKSLGGACDHGCYALLSNGILFIPLVIASAGLYRNMVGPLPNWFFKMDDWPDSKMAFLLFFLFLSPFIYVGMKLIWNALLHLFGRIQVVLQPSASWVTTGIGPVVKKQRFSASQVSQVRIVTETLEDDESDRTYFIQISEENSSLRFGKFLQQHRRNWLCAALNAVLFQPEETEKAFGIKIPAWLKEST